MRRFGRRFLLLRQYRIIIRIDLVQVDESLVVFGMPEHVGKYVQRIQQGGGNTVERKVGGLLELMPEIEKKVL